MLRSRLVARAVVGTLIVASLTGCITTRPPDIVETDACSPSSIEPIWSEPRAAREEIVGVQRLTRTGGKEQLENIVLDGGNLVFDTNAGAIESFDGDRAAWSSALVRSARAATSLPIGWGDPVTLPEEGLADPPDDPDSRWILGVGLVRSEVDFAFDCDGTPITGTLSGLGGDRSVLVVECADSFDELQSKDPVGLYCTAIID
jgi:hypothetical protein